MAVNCLQHDNIAELKSQRTSVNTAVNRLDGALALLQQQLRLDSCDVLDMDSCSVKLPDIMNELQASIQQEIIHTNMVATLGLQLQ